MSIWTLLFILAFVAMIAMHLRGHGGHAHDDEHAHRPDATPPDADARVPEDPSNPEDPSQPVGAAGSHGGHGGHRHAC
jgi:hypothetical protein